MPLLDLDAKSNGIHHRQTTCLLWYLGTKAFFISRKFVGSFLFGCSITRFDSKVTNVIISGNEGKTVSAAS